MLTDAFINGIGFVFLWLVLADISLLLLRYDFWRYGWWGWAFRPVYTIVCFLLACGYLIRGDYFYTGVYSAYALMGAWNWWHDDENKRRRRKLRKKLAERIANRGGKLVVVRPTSR